MRWNTRRPRKNVSTRKYTPSCRAEVFFCVPPGNSACGSCSNPRLIARDGATVGDFPPAAPALSLRTPQEDGKISTRSCQPSKERGTPQEPESPAFSGDPKVQASGRISTPGEKVEPLTQLPLSVHHWRKIPISPTGVAGSSFAELEILGPERTIGCNQPARTETKCRSFQAYWLLVTQAQTSRGSLPSKPTRLPRRKKTGTIKPSSRKQAPRPSANQKRLGSPDVLRLGPPHKSQPK